MTSRTTRGIAAALGTLAILAGSASQVGAAENNQTVAKQSNPTASPAAYADYLQHSREDGASDTLKAFQDLTQAQQNRFIDYLRDPAVLKAFFDKGANQGNGVSTYTRNSSTTTSLHNGAVTIGHERTLSGLPATARRPLPSGNHEVKYNAYVKIFGVKIMRLTLSVNFHSNGRDITKVNSAEATKKNYSGVITLTHTIPKTGMTKWEFCRINPHSCTRGHYANASVIWEGNAVYNGSTLQIDKKQFVSANIHGKLHDYYLHNV